MTGFMHSLWWTVGGMLAVLFVGLALLGLPAAARVRASNKTYDRTYDEPKCNECTHSLLGHTGINWSCRCGCSMMTPADEADVPPSAGPAVPAPRRETSGQPIDFDPLAFRVPGQRREQAPGGEQHG